MPNLLTRMASVSWDQQFPPVIPLPLPKAVPLSQSTQGRERTVSRCVFPAEPLVMGQKDLGATNLAGGEENCVRSEIS